MTNEELAALDLAVARAEGLPNPYIAQPYTGPECFVDGALYDPTRKLYGEVLRLQEKHRIGVEFKDGQWVACAGNERGTIYAFGPTIAIAICRAVVALNKDRTDGR